MITKKGVVVKISGAKTIKVQIRNLKKHPKYKKTYYVTKNIMAHDEKETAKLNDVVEIKQSRPISKKKHWTLDKIVTSPSQ